MKILSNILLCLFFGGVLFVVGGFCALFVVFSSGKVLYGYVVMAAFVGLFIYTIMMLYGFINKKRLNYGLGIFMLICILTASGYKISEVVEKNIPTVNDEIVDLNNYKPFKDDTKAVSLSEASTLKLKDNLPRLDGATALYPLYSAFARAVYPEGDYEVYDGKVMCSTTDSAYRNLIEGNADIIFAARPSNEQLEAAKAKGIELKLTPIGREAFVFFVNSKNKVEGLTKEQVQGIYSGQITNWKEVGGKNEDIRAFQRPRNSGSQTMLEKFMERKKLMTPPSEDIVSMMGGIIKKTSDYKNYKNSIGYSFLYYATEMVKNNQIRLIKIDGVYPSRETIRNGQYPLSAEFYAVTAGSTNPNVQPFINWILGNQGEYLIEKTGYTSMNSGK
ncbi:substrate-binding domain-containing protein [Clostridium swellfunianum]|uniref:PstS family phosphate ABC transporter substrate-binding protein n=1 Tax=Clostridium swellfunianum TaxID=1367462 RepID=UPI00202ED684|nr:substrate-binding domain-containing protein [Clostridium swellfunianum]MCM0649116.1 substrate-binding domain-containing protein [Clostridium swellfunianum]